MRERKHCGNRMLQEEVTDVVSLVPNGEKSTRCVKAPHHENMPI